MLGTSNFSDPDTSSGAGIAFRLRLNGKKSAIREIISYFVLPVSGTQAILTETDRFSVYQDFF